MMHNYTIEFQDKKQCRVTVGSWQDVVTLHTPSVRTIAIVDEAVAERFDLGEHFHEMYTLSGGEQAKSMDMARQIWDMLVECEADRQTLLVAIGGGAVCDLVNFVASTYMRGIKVVLMPTTLLSQVDAAIGGKCGVNVGGYKNMVGTFNLPCEVVCDTEWLGSLPEREWRSGLAEVIKTAIVGDSELLTLLEQTTLDNIRSSKDLQENIVARCAKVKCDIVQQDPYDKGCRRKLNLGHTIGHAIESLTQRYSHGEAVAIGTAWIARKSAQDGRITPSEAERIVALLARYGLPTSLPAEFTEEEVLEAARHDKKSQNNAIQWVMVEPQ